MTPQPSCWPAQELTDASPGHSISQRSILVQETRGGVEERSAGVIRGTNVLGLPSAAPDVLTRALQPSPR